MERKSQNLEFSQNLNAITEEPLEKRSHNCFSITRPVCESGGDIAAAKDVVQANSTTSSLHSFNTVISDEQLEDTELSDDRQTIQSAHHDVVKMPVEGKKHATASMKRRGKYSEVGTKLKTELSKYKKELKEYNNTTKDLEEKYLKINTELGEMQQKHDLFVANRKSKSNEPENYSDSSFSTSAGSVFSLKRKYTQVFHRGNSFLNMMPPPSQSSNDNLPSTFLLSSQPESEKNQPHKNRQQTSSVDFVIRDRESVPAASQKKHSKRKSENKENDQTISDRSSFFARNQTAGLKDIYRVLKNVLDTNQKSAVVNRATDVKELHTTINNMETEQAHFRSIIKQQQNCLQDYHTRCIKAQHIMQTQQTEIEKLNSNNRQLESEITNGIDQLCVKIDSKLRGVSHLPQLVRDEQSKYEKVTKENNMLGDRLRMLQGEATQLKLKIDELGRRKTMTMNRLKAAERDLKIFKNYNTALKHEKRKLTEELQKLKEQHDLVQNSSKRSLARQRDQSEKQRRDLQKRVFELELKLSRSQNSTSGLIQERDSLIAELQAQLNTLVHNFEVSQKHIRVLRRHIYSMSAAGSNRSSAGLISSAV